ncbi:hypothetical protein HDV05_004536 [Chytridiales sp. JEL 0842]|nr:hypothetical protein HDV05_004536 [Chytridiales sp. JEL 0842]
MTMEVDTPSPRTRALERRRQRKIIQNDASDDDDADPGFIIEFDNNTLSSDDFAAPTSKPRTILGSSSSSPKTATQKGKIGGLVGSVEGIKKTGSGSENQNPKGGKVPVEVKDVDLPPGFRKTVTYRPDGRVDPLYHAPDGTKIRSLKGVKQYLAENGLPPWSTKSGSPLAASKHLEISTKGAKKDGGAKATKTPATTKKAPASSSAKATTASKDTSSSTTSSPANSRRSSSTGGSLSTKTILDFFGKKAESALKPQSTPASATKTASIASTKAASVSKPATVSTKKKADQNDDDDFEEDMPETESESESSGSEFQADLDKPASESEADEEEDDASNAGESAEEDDDFESAPKSRKASSRRQSTASVKKAPVKSMVQSSLSGFLGVAEPVTKTAKKRSRSTAAGNKSKKAKTMTEDGSDGEQGDGFGELEPISKLPDMFYDLVSRTPDFVDAVKKLDGHRIRVATMCSGTESPLLALGMISRALKSLDPTAPPLLVDHVFSCEIEPFKQAYIERNFSPPLLFRDVRELGGDTATTAYGARVPVPGHVDMLIAGTSCVDYSNLNNQKQDIDAKGESGETFRGMLKYVQKHRVPLVILENVCGAPWEKVVKFFREIGYNANFMRLDTKQFYLPHTRTRVYLLATPKGGVLADDVVDEWETIVKSMQRKSSTPLEDYLILSDDPRIHQAREDLAKTKDETSRRGRLDWSRCEARHSFQRLEEKLGTNRPLTAWSDGGMSNLPDFAWNDWGRAQTDRVLDLMDINYLRLAKTGVDATSKTLVWNLSQNVDRTTASVQPGICPCLTPSMIPFITNRGGPLVGLEALSLQGIPVDELLLTRETEDQLADLAGNAMTSTVVGSCAMAAIIVGLDALLATRSADDGRPVSSAETTVDAEAQEVALEKRVVGCTELVERPLDLGVQMSMALTELLEAAAKSARHCACEGRESIAVNPVQKCQDCGHTSCTKCGGRPEHSYDTEHLITAESRVNPATFKEMFKKVVPMKLPLNGLSRSTLVDLLKSKSFEMEETLLNEWMEVVSKAFDDGEFRYQDLVRQEVWTAIYASPSAKLLLSLDPRQPSWTLFVERPKGASITLTDTLTRAVASMKIDREMDASTAAGLFSGVWDVCIPKRQTFTFSVTGTGALVDSWESRIGLEGDFKGKRVWSKYKIQLDEASKSLLKVDISGTYKLVYKCGTAMDSLHCREDAKDPMFFFLDPTRCGNGPEDSFVFAANARRLAHREDRGTIAYLSPSWRPNDVEGPQNVDCNIHGVWVSLPETVKFGPTADLRLLSAKMSALTPDTYSRIFDSVTTKGHACDAAVAVVKAEVPLNAFAESVWTEGRWSEIDIVKQGRTVFEKLSWFTNRMAMPTWINEWNVIEGNVQGTPCNRGDDLTPCQRCAPAEPDLIWVPKPNGKGVEGREDSVQAAVYEQALKNRPTAFVSQLRMDGPLGTFRIGVNFSSLIHRAQSRLPKSNDPDAPKAVLSWRLVTNVDMSHKTFPILKLTSNRHDKPSAQPPNFIKYPLRPEQLRSLAWMIAQESDDAPPFVEEEISEASLEHLGWRAEGRATREVSIKGGIVADEVGYGKTAITLGLIDATQKSVTLPLEEKIPGLIPVKATLIYVPGHLLVQWPSEISKFMSDSKSVLVIKDLNCLNRYTIAEIQRADIVIASSKLFGSEKYWENLENLAAAGKLPGGAKKGGRYFIDRYEKLLEGLKEQVKLLKSGKGTQDMVARINEALERAVEEANSLSATAPSKRIVGKAFREQGKDEGNGSSEDEKASKKKPKKAQKLGKGVADPWGLLTREVDKNWRKMKSPPFEIFHWNRVVVDEFTYLDGRVHAGVLHLNAKYRWVLSGTPPVKDFHDIKSMAVFLGVHLGVDDESDFNSKAAKKRRTEATKVEQFHAFREIHTLEWHARRHSLAQTFLDRFVRQNVAEIDEILSEERELWVTLPPAERAIYLELEHHLQAMDMNASKATRSKRSNENDREKRMMKALGKSITAEEALLKRCSHFDIDLEDDQELSGKDFAVNKKAPGRGAARKKTKVNYDEDEDDEDELQLTVAPKSKKRGTVIGSDDSDDDAENVSGIMAESASKSSKTKFTALETCDAIVNARRKQMEDCQKDIRKMLKQTKEFQNAVRKHPKFKTYVQEQGGNDASAEFDKWLKTFRSAHNMDNDANNMLFDLMVETGCASAKQAGSKNSSKMDLDEDDDEQFEEDEREMEKAKLKKMLDKPKSVKADKAQQPKASKKKRKNESDKENSDGDESPDDEDPHAERMRTVNTKPVAESAWEVREMTHVLRKLHKELAGRVRSLRFFEFVRNLLRKDDRMKIIDDASFNCLGESCQAKSEAEKKKLALDQIAVLSCCGHSGCAECIYLAASNQKCVDPLCGMYVHDKAVVKASCLRTSSDSSTLSGEGDDDYSDLVSGDYGAKIMKLIEILRDVIQNKKEKALIFVQFDGLMEKVAEALDASNIGYIQIKGTTHQTSSALQRFQDGGAKGQSVLLLKVDDESAAGANLTMANNVIFIGPVLTTTQEKFTAIETQAIGRARRYGQTKKVMIWRLLARDTIDSQMHEKRQKYLASR